MKKIIRITTVPYSLGSLLKNQLKFMSDYYEMIAISSSEPEGMLVEMTKDQGVKTIPVKMTRKITPLTDLSSIYSLYKIFKKEKPFIVHTHTPKAGLVGMIAAYLARVPHRLHTVAGMPLLEVTGLKRRILDSVEKITYGCATKVYPNSFGLHEIILKNKYTKSRKLKVIGKGSSNGIDTSHFSLDNYDTKEISELKKSLQIAPKDFVYIFVGRLVKDKGINELISVFNKLSQQNKDIKLVLVGAYEKDLDPVDKITEQHIENNPAIITVGPQRDVRPYMAISDLLVFPSYREGFPNVVMEAGAMQLPAIVTDINGCNEIIVQNENGVIIPVKNEEALFKHMNELYLNKNQLNRLAKNTRNLITSRFERKYIWRELLDEYKHLEV